MEYRVSAIILDYRAAHKTETCLRSLIGQGLATVYLVDNSASEQASSNLRDIVHRLRPISDYRIELLCPGENLGFARGVNFALRCDARSSAPHDYYLLLNNDAIAGSFLVHGLIRAIERDPNIALVSPRIVSSTMGRERGIWYHRYAGLLLSQPSPSCFHYFTGCCLLFRKELMDANGLFDESFFMYGEDAELAWRLTRQGRQMSCADDVVVEHEYGPSVNRSSFFYEYHMTRGHLLLSVKTTVWSVEVIPLLLLKFAALACRAALRSIRYRTLVPLLAWIAAPFSFIPIGTSNFRTR